MKFTYLYLIASALMTGYILWVNMIQGTYFAGLVLIIIIFLIPPIIGVGMSYLLTSHWPGTIIAIMGMLFFTLFIPTIRVVLFIVIWPACCIPASLDAAKSAKMKKERRSVFVTADGTEISGKKIPENETAVNGWISASDGASTSEEKPSGAPSVPALKMAPEPEVEIAMEKEGCDIASAPYEDERPTPANRLKIGPLKSEKTNLVHISDIRNKHCADYRSASKISIRDDDILIIDSQDEGSTVSKEDLWPFRGRHYSKVVITANISKIGRAAFSGMSLYKVEFTNNLRMIDNSAFEHCVGLTEIRCTSGDPTVFIGDHAVGRNVTFQGFRPKRKW